MSDKKNSSPRELAVKFLNGILPSLKKYEEVLLKANTAHEIEAGGEPQSEGAEIPQSLVSAAPKAGASKSGSAPKKKMGSPAEGESEESSEPSAEAAPSAEGESEEKSEPAEMEDQPLDGAESEPSEDGEKKKKFEFAKAEKLAKAKACPPAKENNKESQKDKMLSPEKVKHQELEKSDKGIVKLKKFMEKNK